MHPDEPTPTITVTVEIILNDIANLLKKVKDSSDDLESLKAKIRELIEKKKIILAQLEADIEAARSSVGKTAEPMLKDVNNFWVRLYRLTHSGSFPSTLDDIEIVVPVIVQIIQQGQSAKFKELEALLAKGILHIKSLEQRLGD